MSRGAQMTAGHIERVSTMFNATRIANTPTRHRRRSKEDGGGSRLRGSSGGEGSGGDGGGGKPGTAGATGVQGAEELVQTSPAASCWKRSSKRWICMTHNDIFNLREETEVHMKIMAGGYGRREERREEQHAVCCVWCAVCGMRCGV